jgi:hypothetical protein
LRGFTTILPIIPALVCMSTFVVVTAAYRGPTAEVRELIEHIRDYARIWLR